MGSIQISGNQEIAVFRFGNDAKQAIINHSHKLFLGPDRARRPGDFSHAIEGSFLKMVYDMRRLL
jgi:hypothetical protein